MDKKYLVGINITMNKGEATLEIAMAMKECLKKHYKIGYLIVEEGITVEIECLIKGIEIDGDSEGGDDISKNIQTQAGITLNEIGIKPKHIGSIIYDNTTRSALVYIDVDGMKLRKQEVNIMQFDL
ncbi:hypothetical protein [Clostridium sp.]|uniref:hypothetical protein n=1 Tax=Clostridium sp. TaxID=1506 RepID=UPI001A448557|nr:hypothetical protein [Clostridium sp.]MBK5241691.1 hypothetical protein [Clostridium sp.]